MIKPTLVAPATYQTLAGITLWAAVLYGTLRLGNVGGDWGHSICGPWGCGPPVQVLAACHGFWLVFLALPITWFVWHLPANALRRTGKLLAAIGLLCLIAIVCWETAVWLPQATSFQKQYAVQRYLFAVATLVDLPATEIFMFGVACWATAAVRQSRSG